MNEDVPVASGIYKITCAANNTIYIGSAINLRKRKKEHFYELQRNKHCNVYLQRAWNIYGEQAFTFEVLELVLPMSLIAREQYWLNTLKPGFNIAREAGSSLGVKRTPETIEKIRQNSLGNKNLLGHEVSSKTREQIRQKLRGRKLSPEQIEKRKGREKTPEEIEKLRQAQLGNKHCLGRKLSPEHREKIGKAHRGKKHSLEHIEKQRQAILGHTQNLGRKHTPEARENMRQAALAREARKRAERTNL